MVVEQFENNYTTLLNGAIDDDDTTIEVDAGPTTMTGNFRIRIDDEIIFVGSVDGTSLEDCERGAEGTTAASHSDNVLVRHVVTAGALRRALETLEITSNEDYPMTSGTFVNLDSVGSGPDLRITWEGNGKPTLFYVEITEWGSNLGVVGYLDIEVDSVRLGGTDGIVASPPEVSSGIRTLVGTFVKWGIAAGSHTAILQGRTSSNTAHFTSSTFGSAPIRPIKFYVIEL